MNTRLKKHLISAAALASILLPCPQVLAQDATATPTNGPLTTAPATAANSAPKESSSSMFGRLLNGANNWYFSWGYSRQQYAPSDIHVTQPSQGNNFTVNKAEGSDFPATPRETVDSLFNLDITNPQENIRLGKFMNADKTFAIEFSLDHSKYNTNPNQTARISGTVNNQPYDRDTVLDSQTFEYNLHNGLNHIMINAVWLNNLYGPHDKPGELQAISRVGAGILLPHADNTIMGKHNQVGPKNENVCCFNSNDWWQVNGWTAGVEVGLRYRFYKSMYVEFTEKIAYGVLRNVPVYQGSADQTLWMSEQVFSLGVLF